SGCGPSPDRARRLQDRLSPAPRALAARRWLFLPSAPGTPPGRSREWRRELRDKEFGCWTSWSNLLTDGRDEAAGRAKIIRLRAVISGHSFVECPLCIQDIDQRARSGLINVRRGVARLFRRAQ